MYETTLEQIHKAQAGDKKVVQEIIDRNIGLVWNIIKRFRGVGYEIDDLFQIGCMGFIKAIQRFDASFNVKLSTYAVPVILGEIKRFLRDDGPIKISRSIKEIGIKINELQKEYYTKNGEEISIEKLSQILNVSKEDIVIAIEASRPIESIYNENPDNDKSPGIIDKLSTNQDEADIIANRLTINKLINNLEEKEKQIITLRYYKEKTQR